MAETELPAPSLAEREAELGNELIMFRFVWSPDDVRDGTVMPSAFKKDDLKDMERRVSVDRLDMLDEGLIKTRAAEQQKKADPERGIHREEPYGTLLEVGSVRAFRDTEGRDPFSVAADPKAENPGHCAIGNKSGKSGKAYVLELRTALADIAYGTKKLDNFFSS